MVWCLNVSKVGNDEIVWTHVAFSFEWWTWWLLVGLWLAQVHTFVVSSLKGGRAACGSHCCGEREETNWAICHNRPVLTMLCRLCAFFSWHRCQLSEMRSYLHIMPELLTSRWPLTLSLAETLDDVICLITWQFCWVSMLLANHSIDDVKLSWTRKLLIQGIRGIKPEHCGNSVSTYVRSTEMALR